MASPSIRLLAVAVLVAGALAACDTESVGSIAPAPEAVDNRPGGFGDLDSVRYVVHVSIDGLRPDAVDVLGDAGAPALSRLLRESVHTHNARTDPGIRHTLPNHISQLTGRSTYGESGHGWSDNDGLTDATVHGNQGTYVPSVFDVVHDHGGRTGAYVSKEKFSLLERSYAFQGAPDVTGPDDGANKLDVYFHHHDTDRLLDRLASDLLSDPPSYSFVHLRDPDFAGHEHGWDLGRGSPYLTAVERSDSHVRRVIDTIEADGRLQGRTVVLVTSDHGGRGREHGSAHIDHIRVPFYVWGPGIRPGDLYTLNTQRLDPADDQGAAPIRNGDAANLSLSLLGLPAVPGSTLGGLEVAR
ncbi:alkaline phosphatase family protein [Rubrivirga sp.]|uniref:alkaline phosphatase family protein n=1 Tax=Rubrivirga sp. TaxID=1885344 RepID=UPI003C72351F